MVENLLPHTSFAHALETQSNRLVGPTPIPRHYSKNECQTIS
jgi:hypothetical protein